MAKLWGINSTDEHKPVWLTKQYDIENCYATKGGWVLKHKDGTEETLVAIAGLSTKLGSATITNVIFPTGTYYAGQTQNIIVSYDEKVTVTGTPTLTIASSLSGNITATYSGTSDSGNSLIFTFTVPAVGNDLTVSTQAMGGSATIVETGSVIAAEQTIPSNTSTVSATRAAHITAVAFGTGTYTAGTSKQVKVTYSAPVTVTGTPTLVVHGTTDASTTASYASTSTDGLTLTFNFTVPTAGQTLSIAAQNVALAGGTIVMRGVTPTANGEVAIDSTAATGAGTKTTV